MIDQARISAVRKAAFAAQIAPEHEVSLQAMGNGPLRPIIPDDHADALVAAGLAQHSVGGLMLTDAGATRLASHK